MPREVVGVGVGNEGGFPRIPGIQPEIQLGKMDSPVENDLDHDAKLTVTGDPAIPYARTIPRCQSAPGTLSSGMPGLEKWFESVETDSPFETCKVCTRFLQFAADTWVVNKHYHREECVMEYAVCEDCRDGLSRRFSETSRAAIRHFLENEINWEQRMTDWLTLADPTERLENCVACRMPRFLTDGFAISAQYRRDGSLVEGALPLMMCSDCMATVTASLSAESRAVWRDFVEKHFEGPGSGEIDLGIF